MPDTPFKSMSPEAKKDHRKPRGKGEPCDKCGMTIWPGDWPWCTPGNPQDHLR